MLSTVPPFAPIPFDRDSTEVVRRVEEQSAPKEVDFERQLAIQLMHLASQFHASDYSRAKFGARGSALTYIPLSIHLPDHFKELQARQALYADGDAWWLFERDATILTGNPTDPVLQASPSVTITRASVDLRDQLSSAIESQIGPPWTAGQPPLLKTSETHPLSISSMIPPELLSTISLHLSFAPASTPAMFQIHPAFSLERLTCCPATPLHTLPPPPPPTEPLPNLPLPIPIASVPSAQFQVWNRVSMKNALQSALSTNIRTPGSTPHLPPLTFTDMDLLGEILARANAQASDDNTLQSPGPGARHERAYSAPPAVFKAILSDSLGATRRSPHPSSLKTPYANTRRNWDVAILQANPRRPRMVHFASQIPTHPPVHIDTPTPVQASAPPTLGNLLLSSCPGKKVRLNGPVRGRGAVCRDLQQDLKRIKALDVGCVVCCLDDEELDFLGASWPEYVKAAREIKLDVLRVPIPEGLSPMSPEAFDAHLTRLIAVYTLAGTPVLVHCRGGVGRAGLVACCWMLKLGLCGWPAGTQQGEAISEGQVRKDTLELVERVIGVVRRRRSLKAIETYEQVKFLVTYVEFLRARAAPGTE
ncbi:phosphatases II [Artomyces pyxidatus]|uniref:Phosphatases II n=1 Tax=Artomyces pyxidatus TaxID=48021 RepID=A0ACB8T5E9_9AGAM|nr:phosphatases II [Artomyces pyxidatus]